MYEGNLTSYHNDFIFSFTACFTKLLNDFFATIFRYRRYNRSRILVVMCNANRLMFGVFTFSLTHFLAKIFFSRGYVGCTK